MWLVLSVSVVASILFVEGLYFVALRLGKRQEARIRRTRWRLLRTFSIIVLSAVLFVLIVQYGRVREGPPRSDSCQNNVKELFFAMEGFAKDNPKGRFPELDKRQGALMFANAGKDYPGPFYPTYLRDLRYLLCPCASNWPPVDRWEDAAVMTGSSSYLYLGYVVTNDDEMETFAAAYREHLAQGVDFSEDLAVPQGTGNGGGDRLYRLANGVEMHVASNTNDPAALEEARGHIPVLIERLRLHFPAGGNVVFLDGRVEYMRYPDRWPMTPRMISLLNSLAPQQSIE